MKHGEKHKIAENTNLNMNAKIYYGGRNRQKF